MENLFHYKSRSLANTRVLCTLALLCALYVALASVSISLTESLRISFSFLALAASCYFFGIWPNIIMAFAADLLGYLIHPQGVYTPFYALIVMTNAVIYSLFFYGRNKVGWSRVILGKGVSTILCNIFLNPLVLCVLYQMPYWTLVSARIVKNLILFPIECILLYLVLELCWKIRQRSSWL